MIRFLAALFLSIAAIAADRPNILWLTTEDIGPNYGCYGDKYANTPNIDALAARGIRFKRAWSNAPVCAPARTCGLIKAVNPSRAPPWTTPCASPWCQMKPA